MPHSAPTSHTSTEQWQSFEIRMRHRRAERCVVRAEAALEAGLEDEARAALAEARALNPHAPDFETASASVRARQAAALAAAQRARARRTGAIAVFVGTIATAAIALWIGSSGADIGPPEADGSTGAPAPAHVAATASTPPPPARSPEAQAQPDTVVSTPVATSTDTAPESPVRTTGSTDRPVSDADRPPTRPASETTVRTPPVSQAAGASAAESSLPPVGDVSSSIPLTRAPAASADTSALGGNVPPPRGPDGLVKELPSAALPVVSAPPAPAPAPAAEPEAPAEVTRVRAVLARFEAAYSSLDASAARSVWPSVDERSLERAFNSLESQQVSLGRCSIVLSGATARADCSGSTSWTPKVGGGRHTEARHWEFDLTSRNGAWQIVRANAR